ERKGDDARLVRTGGDGRNRTDNGDQAYDHTQQPVAHDAANRQTEQHADRMQASDRGEMREGPVGGFMRWQIVAGGGGVLNGAVVGHLQAPKASGGKRRLPRRVKSGVSRSAIVTTGQRWTATS